MAEYRSVRETKRINTPTRVNLGGGKRKQRTAVYCRVSTELETQELSLENQMITFTKLINANPNMELAGVYADEGVTGTSVRKRGQFLKMMADAEAGKFDTVMTKGISRFARNTVSCLEYVRKLRKLGINVIFVKEQLDTANIMSEMLLTVLSAFAEEESRSISENLKWGIRKRYEMGEGRWTPIYGYRYVDKTVVIDEKEAEIVRNVFEMYRTGKSLPMITQWLNDEGYSSPRGTKWTDSTVAGMLRSERYVGDLILQKYVTIDFIDHISVPNVKEKLPDKMEEAPSYYVRNSHIPIIDRRTHEQVQRIMELKAPRGECSRYPYEDAPIYCPFCGKKLTTRLMHVQKEKKALCCFGDDGCHGFAVKTWMLDEVLRCAFEELEDIPGYGDAAKRMRKMKAAGTPDSIEYYFLADAVKKITFSGTEGTRTQRHKKGPATVEKTCDWEVTIEWQCGLTSTLPLPHDDRYTEEPTHVAELYERYLERIRTGEYIPTRPKNIRERKMKEQQVVVTRRNQDDHKEN